MTPTEHHEFCIGWDAYQLGNSDINVCTSMLQRRGWLAARAAEEAVYMYEARAEQEHEDRGTNWAYNGSYQASLERGWG